jgi:hypothetical protein
VPNRNGAGVPPNPEIDLYMNIFLLPKDIKEAIYSPGFSGLH